jgi:hypothetical protein
VAVTGNVPEIEMHDTMPSEPTPISSATAVRDQGLCSDHQTGKGETLLPSVYTPVATNCARLLAVLGLMLMD